MHNHFPSSGRDETGINFDFSPPGLVSLPTLISGKPNSLGGTAFASFLLNKITPIMATSNKIETTSKGSTYWVNKSLPNAAVPPSIVGESAADKSVLWRHF